MVSLGEVTLDFEAKGLSAFMKLLEGINKMADGITDSLKGVTAPMIENTAKFGKQLDTINKINKKFGAMEKVVKDTSDAFGPLKDNTFITFFTNLNSKILKFGQRQALIQQLGGSFGILKFQITQTWNALQMAFGPGALNIIMGLGKALMSMVPHLVIIGAAVGLAFKIWQNNIGNIQGLWIRLIGRLQNTYAKFDVALRKALLNLEPLFTAVLKPTFSLINGFVTGLLEGFTVVADVLGFVGKAISPIINLLNKLLPAGNAVEGMFGGMGAAIGKFIAIALSITVIVKVFAAVKAAVLGLHAVWLLLNTTILASPIGWIVLGVAALVGIIVLLWKKVEGFRNAVKFLWDAMKTLFTGIVNFIKAPLESLQKFFSKFDSIAKVTDKIKGFFEGKKELNIAANIQPPATGNGRTIQNNFQTTVHTSGPMNETNAYRIGTTMNKGLSRNISTM